MMRSPDTKAGASAPHHCAICMQEPGHGYRSFARLLGRILRSLWVAVRAASSPGAIAHYARGVRRTMAGGKGP